MISAKDYSIVHIHPTLNCNLKCLHCYSSSEPNLKLGLDLDSLLPYLEYLRNKHDFNVISISGGEPFLYAPLKDLLKSTRELGYYNQVVSNGMLLRSKRNQECLEYIDSMAISIDGDKTLHNEMRASEFAYDKMLEGVAVLQEHKMPFGFIHTVTKKSWQKIPDLVALAQDAGATLLQLHPIENVGRATTTLDDDFYLSQEDLHRLFILSSIIEGTSGMKIQLDLLHKQFLLDQPGIVFGNVGDYSSLQDLCKEIIITEKGKVLPISYGFSEEYLIHELNDKSLNYKKSIENFLAHKGEDLKDLLHSTYHKMIHDEAQELFKWGALIVEESKGVAV